MRAVLASLAVTLLALSSACTVYFGDDDVISDDTCDYGAPAAGGADFAPIRLVDPYNLACEDFGGYGCPDYCGPCAEYDVAIPSWGYCESACTYLGEGDCLDTPGCRAAYDWACYTGDGPCSALQAFAGCYAVDTTGPVQGPCDGLDAWSCSQHDDCVALHDSTAGNAFVECRAEAPTACEAIGTEDACLARGDCSPRYTGEDCTCDEAGNCTCATWVFLDCITGREPGGV